MDRRLQGSMDNVAAELQELKSQLRDLLLGHKQDLDSYRAQVDTKSQTLRSELMAAMKAQVEFSSETVRGEVAAALQASEEALRADAMQRMQEQRANDSALQDQFLQFKVQNGSARDEHRHSVMTSLDAMSSRLQAELAHAAQEHQALSESLRSDVDSSVASLREELGRLKGGKIDNEAMVHLEERFESKVARMRADIEVIRASTKNLELTVAGDVARVSEEQAAIADLVAKLSEEQVAVAARLSQVAEDAEALQGRENSSVEALETLLKKAIACMSSEIKATMEEFHGMHSASNESIAALESQLVAGLENVELQVRDAFVKQDSQIREDLARCCSELRSTIDDHHEGLLLQKNALEALDTEFREDLAKALDDLRLDVSRQVEGLKSSDASLGAPEELKAMLMKAIANMSAEQQTILDEFRVMHEGQTHSMAESESVLRKELERIGEEARGRAEEQQDLIHRHQEAIDSLNCLLQRAIESMSEEQRATLNEFHGMHDMHQASLDALEVQLRSEFQDSTKDATSSTVAALQVLQRQVGDLQVVMHARAAEAGAGSSGDGISPTLIEELAVKLRAEMAESAEVMRDLIYQHYDNHAAKVSNGGAILEVNSCKIFDELTIIKQTQEELTRSGDDLRKLVGSVQAECSLHGARHCALNATVLSLETRMRDSSALPSEDGTAKTPPGVVANSPYLPLTSDRAQELLARDLAASSDMNEFDAASQCSLNFSVSTGMPDLNPQRSRNRPGY
jgi:hypothetical protein